MNEMELNIGILLRIFKYWQQIVW